MEIFNDGTYVNETQTSIRMSFEAMASIGMSFEAWA